MNTILSACYHACYEEGVSDEDELVLVTAPISATSEVEALYNSGILDWKTAIPAALHSLGCTSVSCLHARPLLASETPPRAADGDHRGPASTPGAGGQGGKGQGGHQGVGGGDRQDRLRPGPGQRGADKGKHGAHQGGDGAGRAAGGYLAVRQACRKGVRTAGWLRWVCGWFSVVVVQRINFANTFSH